MTGAPNIKETLAWGPEGDELNLYHGPNKVPDIDQFELIVNGYCQAMIGIGFKLIDAFEAAFNNLTGLRDKFAPSPRLILKFKTFKKLII